MKNNRKKYLSVKVWRSKKETEGFFEKFSVPFFESQTILDLVSWIQQNEDPSLTYRFACRVGMCGSCAMMVNGEPRWTCRTHVNKILAKSEDIEIAPLRNLPVIKDLVTNMDKFFEKWIEAEGVFHPTKTKKDKLPSIKPDTAQPPLRCNLLLVIFLILEYFGPEFTTSILRARKLSIFENKLNMSLSDNPLSFHDKSCIIKFFGPKEEISLILSTSLLPLKPSGD